MNVLGYSGLDGSEAFKRRHFPNPRHATIAPGRHAAAALITTDGHVYAASEERFTGLKGTGRFPAQAAAWCLELAGLTWNDIDAIAHGFDYEAYRSVYANRDQYDRQQFELVMSRPAQEKVLEEQLGPGLWAERLVAVQHHEAHAASAFWPSGFEDALIIVADGMGEVDWCTVATGSRDGIQVLQRYPADNSLGIFYAVLTQYLGFTPDRDEHKMMGLASSGNPRRHFARMNRLAHPNPRSPQEVLVPLLWADHSIDQRETHAGAIALLESEFGPRREPEAPLEPRHRDVAAAGQKTLQFCLHELIRHYRLQTGLDSLCVAGGVGLNAVANGALLRSGLSRRIFVQPAAGDDGAALGAALQVHHQRGHTVRPSRLPLWGPEYTAAAIEQTVTAAAGINAEFLTDAELPETVAGLLANGAIIGWFQGAMEFGPRALGNRSILADPRRVETRHRINRTLKRREDFQPIAPAVPAELATRFFEIEAGHESMFEAMLFVCRVRPEWQSQLEAITHVDQTARVQTVARDDCERFWQLLHAFGRISGVPVLVNTSFNGPGQPIVRTPVDAISTHVALGLDASVIGNWLIRSA